MEDKTFKIGALIVLKSSPEITMTVRAILDNNEIEVNWFTKDLELKQATFEKDQLQRVDIPQV